MINIRLLTFAACLALCLDASIADDSGGKEKAVEESPVRALGDERYQIGNIVVDKEDSTFRVTGKVLRTDPPLEFLAVKLRGSKGYESLLELDTSATEFNLACILIGLKTDGVRPADYHFDEKEVIGPPVEITVQWERAGKSFDVPISNLLYLKGKPVASDQWRYTGSSYKPGPDRQYNAELFGVLIGFVHDPASVIDHQTGIGVGEYGSISGNTELLPELGMPLTVTVKYEP